MLDGWLTRARIRGCLRRRATGGSPRSTSWTWWPSMTLRRLARRARCCAGRAGPGGTTARTAVGDAELGIGALQVRRDVWEAGTGPATVGGRHYLGTHDSAAR